MAYGYTHAYPPEAQPPPPPARRRAPTEVHLAAALLYVTSVVLAFTAAAVLAMRLGAISDNDLPEQTAAWVRNLGLPIAALSAVCGLVAVVVGRRVHRGRRWARLFVIVVSVLSLALNGFMLFTSGFADPLTGLVLPVLYLALLNTRPARDFFAGHLP